MQVVMVSGSYGRMLVRVNKTFILGVLFFTLPTPLCQKWDGAPGTVWSTRTECSDEQSQDMAAMEDVMETVQSGKWSR